MKIPRIHVPAPLAEGAELELPPAAARHVLQVLRLRPGARLRVFDGSGREHEAELVAAGRGAARARLGAPVAPLPESPLAVTLIQGVCRGERMDLVVQKAVELGAVRILPVLTARSVPRLDGARAERRQAHWQAVAAAAAEQCGRAVVPEVAPPRPLAAALADATLPAARYLLDPAAAEGPRALAPPGAAAALLVGPEGGLADGERAAAAAAGFRGLRLGPRVLRTETAGLAALAVLQALHGDLG